MRLFYQHHFFGDILLSGLQAIDIDAGRDLLILVGSSVPDGIIAARSFIIIHQCFHQLAGDVVDLQADRAGAAAADLVADVGAGMSEGVGGVLGKEKA